jgi:hypothetical protein
VEQLQPLGAIPITRLQRQAHLLAHPITAQQRSNYLLLVVAVAVTAAEVVEVLALVSTLVL